MDALFQIFMFIIMIVFCITIYVALTRFRREKRLKRIEAEVDDVLREDL